MAADDRHLSSRDGTVLPWPRSVDARWPLLHVLRGGGAFVLPSRHGESAAFVATPVSPLIRRASADACMTPRKQPHGVRTCRRITRSDSGSRTGPARWEKTGARKPNPHGSRPHLKRLNGCVPLAFVSFHFIVDPSSSGDVRSVL
jgi:hypothetical protein